MSTKKLFDEDSEEDEVSFKTENEYAKKYDNWREKEELHKLEQKYGSQSLAEDVSSSSDSEDEDDEPPEVSEEVETQFLKTLALLKTKDPRIYDPEFNAFEEKDKKKEEEKTFQVSKTLIFEDSNDSESGDDGNIFKIEKKAEIATEVKKDVAVGKKSSKEGQIKDFLTGKAEHIDSTVERDLAPLKALWSDPQLNEGEAFLRDYILEKRYLDEGTGDCEDKIRDDEDLEEDERRVEEQGKFERAYNFRFEEPDDEFLKRYPRTMNYTRPKDDRRSKKRAEVRSRKEEEKRRKMEEIARMKALKLKEIQEKIAKIKEVTGNKDLAFKEDDIEGDFDPEEHDRQMKALFDEQFYGHADDEKPAFPHLDEELEIENWEKYEPDHQKSQNQCDDDEPHCEDEDFNMDADYDPKAKLLEKIQSTLGKKRRNRKKKSKLAELLASDKPKFVPVEDQTYSQYMEEYYSMECEDVIGGDLPTRFKYREVLPNDYGLTVEEILLADDKELTQWVPLKKVVKHRPREVEKGEVNTYRLKAADERLKRKILPSLYNDLPPEPEVVVPIEETIKKSKKKKKNKNKDKRKEETADAQENEPNVIDDKEQNGEADSNVAKTKKKKRKHKDIIESVIEENPEINTNKKDKIQNNKEVDKDNIVERKKRRKDSDSSVTYSNKESYEVNTKIQQKTVSLDENIQSKVNLNNDPQIQIKEIVKNKRKKKKNKSTGFVIENVQKQQPSVAGHNNDKNNYSSENKRKNNMKRKMDESGQVPNKKQKKSKIDGAKQNGGKEKSKFNKFKNKQGKDQTPENPLNKLSDERLKAYGLNPKKYRSFLKYKKF